MRRLAFIVGIALVAGGCSRRSATEETALGEGFSDDFGRSHVGSNWRNTGGPYKIVDGTLHVAGARNHPLWLRRTLPEEVRVSFDVWSDSDDGDIKFELFGDGTSFARESSYTASGYVFIFGGWQNSRNVIARMDEHGSDRRERRGPQVEKGRRYRMKVERRQKMISWWVDDQLLLELDDGDPLKGRGHDHFAFNNWETPLFFDDLRIVPLGD